MRINNPYIVHINFSEKLEFLTEKLCNCYITQEFNREKDPFRKALILGWYIETPEGKKKKGKILFKTDDDFYWYFKDRTYEDKRFKRIKEFDHTEDFEADIIEILPDLESYEHLFIKFRGEIACTEVFAGACHSGIDIFNKFPKIYGSFRVYWTPLLNRSITVVDRKTL